MKFKVSKNGPSKQLMELGPATGMWSDDALTEFLGKSDRGWPEKFGKVDGVYFHWGPEVTHFAGFAALPNLKRVWGVSGALKSLDGLEHCKQLELASIPSSDGARVTTLAPLAGLTSLKKLSIRSMKTLSNIDALGSLENLSVLDLAYAERVSSLAPIGKLANLEALSLYGCDLTKLPLDDLAGLSNLRVLDLTARGLKDLSPLAKLPKLQKVRMYGWDGIKLKGRDELEGKLIDGKTDVENFDDNVFDCSE